MKTKDLITVLQEADPSGEVECVVGWEDIHFVERLPGYYDGSYQILDRDPDGGFPKGVTLTKEGDKVRIYALGAEDLLFENPGATVQIDTSLNDRREELEKRVEEWRRAGRS